jgi:hypothetical protein
MFALQLEPRLFKGRIVMATKKAAKKAAKKPAKKAAKKK